MACARPRSASPQQLLRQVSCRRPARSAAWPLRGQHDVFPGIRVCDVMEKLWLAALAVLALGLGLSQAAPQGERSPCWPVELGFRRLNA